MGGVNRFTVTIIPLHPMRSNYVNEYRKRWDETNETEESLNEDNVESAEKSTVESNNDMEDDTPKKTHRQKKSLKRLVYQQLKN